MLGQYQRHVVTGDDPGDKILGGKGEGHQHNYRISFVPSDRLNLVMSSMYIRNKSGPNIDP